MRTTSRAGSARPFGRPALPLTHKERNVATPPRGKRAYFDDGSHAVASRNPNGTGSVYFEPATNNSDGSTTPGRWRNLGRPVTVSSTPWISARQQQDPSGNDEPHGRGDPVRRDRQRSDIDADDRRELDQCQERSHRMTRSSAESNRQPAAESRPFISSISACWVAMICSARASATGYSPSVAWVSAISNAPS